MNISRMFKFIATAGVAGTILGSILIPAKVLAWHPVGVITKFAANQTTGSASVDANTAADAVSAKPGDVIRYTITISNNGQVDTSGNNDLASVQLTDTLPAGVELVSTPSQRTITETVPGTIKPGKSVVKQYDVKVTSTTNGDVIKNTACFTGNSTVNDNKQQGCDVAYVVVKVPPVTSTVLCSALDQPLLIDAATQKYSFTAHAQVTGTASLQNASFDFGDGVIVSNLAPTATNTVTTQHAFPVDSKTYAITATLNFTNVNGTSKSATCSTSLTITKPTPIPTPTPTATPTPTPIPTVLPSTGPEVALGSLTGLGALSYATVSYARSKRSLRGTTKR